MPARPQQLNVAHVLRGNWLGSLAVALVTLAAALLVSAAAAVATAVAGTDIDSRWDLQPRQIVTDTASMLVRSLGGEVAVTSSDTDYSLHAANLTITLVTLGVLVLSFRRMVRGYPRWTAAIGEVVRVSAFLSLALVVLALTTRASLENVQTVTVGAPFDPGSDDRWGPGAVSAGLVGFFVPCFVLLLAGLRSEWWDGRGRAVVRVIGAAVRGVAVIAVLLPVCGIVAIVLREVSEDEFRYADMDPGVRTVAIVDDVLSLPNQGWNLIALGSGAEVGIRTSFGDDEESEMHRLDWYVSEGDLPYQIAYPVDDGHPWLAAAPAVLALVLVAGAVVAGRTSRGTAPLWVRLGGWAVAVGVGTPLLTLLSASRSSSEDSVDRDGFTFFQGADVLQTFLFVTGAALVVGALGALLFGRRDLPLGPAWQSMRSLQQNPSRPPGSE
ncbi:hypothetical protein [Nocardioides sp. MH1]|uniref:hypothetical protein n=1 Tax=Nocardioides sp. MH1 TaxID=3242490 RepID=UPI0035217B5B